MELLLLHEPEQLRRACDRVRADGRRVGLVPTMGALHDGHISLVHEAKRHSDHVVVTVFVNPTQFGPDEDLDQYPRTLDADRARCHEAGADVVFAPSAAAMYLPGEETRIRVGQTAARLCGADRPTHFEGVCTVVTKLLSIVGPCVAVFGRKDYQQLCVIKRFVADLFLPVQVIGAPIVREPDGLAMSSRNVYLSSEERSRALTICRALARASRLFEAGERRAGVLRGTVRALLEPVVDKIDYVEVADPDTVQPHGDDARVGERALLAVAVQIGKPRLIDNVVLGEDAPLVTGE